MPRKGDSGDGDAYRRRKDRETQRQAEQTRRSQNVGPLPKCANRRRRTNAEKSLRKWCDVYFKGRFPLPWSTDHIEQLSAIERVILGGGLQAIAAPRGDGKTTRLEIGVLWGVMTGAHQYAVLLTATGSHAPKRTGSLKTELLTNDLLAADYPEVCHPIRRMAGIVNRCRGLHLDGDPCWPGGSESPWSKQRLVLPTIAGSACSGAICESAGVLEAVRGLNFARADGTVARPTVALIDDPQTDRTSKSVLQSEERESAIAAGILHLPGPDEAIAALLACTVIRPGDMADQMLDRERHPAWHGIRKKLLYKWPSRMDLWDKYAEIYRDDLSAGGDGSKATTFYRRNRKAMDRGAKVAWKYRFAKGELSALEHAMRLYYRDRTSFFSEMQNEPEEDQADTVEMLTAAEISAKVSGYARREMPPAVERLTFFIDVHKQVLYWVVCAWEPSFTGYIVDYGTWPEQKANYFDMGHARQTIFKAKEITAGSVEGKITQALHACLGDLAAREWQRTDGAEVHYELGMIDAQWGEQTDTVYEVCRTAKRKHGLRVMPSHGVPFGPAKKPISRWDRKTTKGRIGDEWHIPPPARGRGIRHVLQDAGRRKSFLHRRLATPAGDPGSLTLYEAPPSRHRLIAEHLTAEVGTKVSGPYGEMTTWSLIPGRDNHWLDCVSGCCTAESILGGKLVIAENAVVDGQKRRPKKKRVWYIE